MLAARPLVDSGVELETDLVDPSRQKDGQSAEVQSLDSILEAFGKAEVKQVGWPRIEPLPAEPQGRPHIGLSLIKRLRQGPCDAVAPVFNEGDDIDIRRGPCYQPK